MKSKKNTNVEKSENETEKSRERLKVQFKTVISDLEELLNVTKDQAGEEIKTVREKAGRTLGKAKSQLDELETSSKEKIIEVVKETNEYAHENPWPLIGTSAAVGLVLGLLINRK